MVKSGMVELTRLREGKPQSLTLFGPGDMVGVVSAILGQSRAGTATATNHATVYRMSLRELVEAAGGREQPVAAAPDEPGGKASGARRGASTRPSSRPPRRAVGWAPCRAHRPHRLGEWEKHRASDDARGFRSARSELDGRSADRGRARRDRAGARALRSTGRSWGWACPGSGAGERPSRSGAWSGRRRRGPRRRPFAGNSVGRVSFAVERRPSAKPARSSPRTTKGRNTASAMASRSTVPWSPLHRST